MSESARVVVRVYVQVMRLSRSPNGDGTSQVIKSNLTSCTGISSVSHGGLAKSAVSLWSVHVLPSRTATMTKIGFVLVTLLSGNSHGVSTGTAWEHNTTIVDVGL